MMDIGKITKRMDMEYHTMKKEMYFMMENGKMTSLTGKEYFHQKDIGSMMDSGKMIE